MSSGPGQAKGLLNGLETGVHALEKAGTAVGRRLRESPRVEHWQPVAGCRGQTRGRWRPVIEPTPAAVRIDLAGGALSGRRGRGDRAVDSIKEERGTGGHIHFGVPPL